MRVTDRPIRTLFPSNFYREVQINNMLMSCDGLRDTDILSVNAASAALTLSDLPFNGPIGAVRIARNEGSGLSTRHTISWRQVILISPTVGQKTR